MTARYLEILPVSLLERYVVIPFYDCNLLVILKLASSRV